MINRKTLSAFLRDENGSMTVEFMIWLPLITFWLVFSTAVFIAWDNRADAAKATFTIADIMSRRTDINPNFLTQLYNLNQRLITNDGRRNLLRISSVMRRPDGDLEVRWTCPMGGALPLADEDIPNEIIPEMALLDSVILVESRVPYTPITVPFAGVLIGGEEAMDERFFDGATEVEWSNRIAIRPRGPRLVSGDNSDCP